MTLRALRPLALAAVLVGAWTGTAHAHATLVEMRPADGTSLTTPPRVITLVFDEEIAVDLSSVTLVGSTGHPVQTRLTSGDEENVLVIHLPALAKDTYRLSWRTVAADDLHTTSGEAAFGVGTAAPAPVPTPAAPPAPGTVGIAVRWVDFSALAVLIGALGVACVVVPVARRRGAAVSPQVTKRLYTLAAVGGTAAILTGGMLLIEQASSLSGRLPHGIAALLTETSYGVRWTSRELAVAGLVVIAARMRRRPPAPALRIAIGAMAIVLGVALASAGHAAAAGGDDSPATAVMAVHLIAAGFWVGGLVAMAAVLRLVRRDDPSGARALLRSFGDAAAVCVALLAATGLFSLGIHVASTDALLQSLYGREMLVKAALISVTLALAAVNLTLLRRPERPAPGRTVALEAVLALAVLIPAAAMAESAPASGSQWRPAATRPALDTVYTETGDLIVRLTVKPNRPGANFASVSVVNTLRPAPGRVTGVDVTWMTASSGSAPMAAVRDPQTGVWRTAASTLPAAAEAPIAVSIHRDGVPDTTARLGWRLGAPASGSNSAGYRPLSPMVDAAALLALLGAVTTAVLLFTPRELIGRTTWAPKHRSQPAK